MTRNAILVGALSAACGEADGVVRIHFGLRPPGPLEIEGDAGPPVDAFDAAAATGSVEIDVAGAHLMAVYDRLPAPGEGLAYRFWVSEEVASHPAEAHGGEVEGSWSFVRDVEPDPGGHAETHAGDAAVPLRLVSIRQGLVTIDPVESKEPGPFVVLSGGTGLDPEEEGGQAPPVGGGHQH